LIAATADLARDIAATRRAFKNWLTIGFGAGIIAPSRIPPRGGWTKLAERRLEFKTRLGPVLVTEIGNSFPIIEIFRDEAYSVPLDWKSIHTVLDVGGHVGAFAIWVATQAEHAQIVTLEPEARNFRDLQRNIERNRLTHRVESLNIAVGAADGSRVLNVPMHRQVSSFEASEGSVPVEVACVAFERCLRERGSVDLVKLDCEGAEWEIFEAVTGEHLRHVQHLLMECHGNETGDFEQMNQRLEERGFSSRTISRGVGGGPHRAVATLWAERRR
jgi:FkbM family methyltransferase